VRAILPAGECSAVSCLAGLSRPIRAAPELTHGLCQEFCCSPGLTCFPTEVATGGVFCCDSTHSSCTVHSETELTCAEGHVLCPRHLGGGCCPDSAACNPSGCVEAHEDVATVSSMPGPGNSHATPTDYNGSTATKAPMPEHTGPKLAQQVQAGVADRRMQNVVAVLALVGVGVAVLLT
jgi:hypothetical protein